MQADDYRQFCERFAFDFLTFVHWAFPWGHGALADYDGPEEWQAEALNAISEELSRGAGTGDANVVQAAIGSGHGVGKGAFIAWVLLAWMATRPNAKGFVTANTMTQLRSKSWPELIKWYKLARPEIQDLLEVKGSRLTAKASPQTWFIEAIPWSKHNPEAVAGEHGPFPIIVFDEASAIERLIWDSVEGAKTVGECLHVVTGNFTRSSGSFVDCFKGPGREHWIRRTVDARTMKRPGINRDLLDRWVEQHGEDSDFVRVRVKGEIPKVGFSNFFDPEDLREARTREIDRAAWENAPLMLGVDVGYTGDLSAFVWRQGLWLPTPAVQTVHGLNPIEVGERVVTMTNERGVDAVMIDGMGIGAGTFATVQRSGLRHCAHNIKAGARSLEKRRAMAKTGGAALEWANLSAEMAGKVRQWLRDGGSLYHADQELIDDMEAIEFTVDPSTGLIGLESKKDMKARGLASPDRFDALKHTFGVELAPTRTATRRGSYRAPMTFDVFGR